MELSLAATNILRNSPEGNVREKKTVQRVMATLDAIGVGRERPKMCNLSATMGQRFAEIAPETTGGIPTLGPSRVRAGRLAGAALRARAS